VVHVEKNESQHLKNALLKNKIYLIKQNRIQNMARRKTSRVARNQSKKKIMMGNLIATLPTKGNIKNSAIETGKDLIIGVVAGGFAGAAIGRPSLLIGLVASGAGHFLENKMLSNLGIGMMASNNFTTKGMQGVDDVEGLEGVKERLAAFKENLAHRTYLDKIAGMKPQAAKAISGLGETQYFSYQQNMLEGANEDLALLNHIENQFATVNGDMGEIGELNAVGYEDAIY
jgi:hypothetical protein